MQDNQALIVVDVQKDFLETGALPVKEGSQVVPVINRIIPKFKNVVFTQDWHPQGHISFASSHPGIAPYSTIDVSYGKQVLWPEHCVQNTSGAEFAEGLNTENGELYPGRKEAKRKLGKCRFEKMAAKKKLLLIKQTCIWENEETDSNLSETAHR